MSLHAVLLILLPLSARLILLLGFAASLAVPLLWSFSFSLCSSVSLAVFRLLLSSFWLRVSLGYMLRFPCIFSPSL